MTRPGGPTRPPTRPAQPAPRPVQPKPAPKPAPKLADCPEAAWGFHGLTDTRGRCPYCGRKVMPAAARPDSFPVADATAAYRYHYDPDFGSDRHDVYA